MRLKTAERILSAFVILMIAAILLCSGTGKLLWGYIGIGLAFAGGIFWIIFGRCPIAAAIWAAMAMWGNTVPIVENASGIEWRPPRRTPKRSRPFPA